ncbi:hypothetical protein [Methylobacterium pseudosasicola]|uniref:Uncharacterized protein n=1 Tax=Methylobacterium pseudosasicola TaxID=582667 RepID=A0A1I4LBP7_9HYPH|nr:hypothetical protein [Methylobacterium pseudosasicola]SFL88286.1 hypothetical protein SAMN05192568_101334 [Methylobacterium pseudosasicola]
MIFLYVDRVGPPGIVRVQARTGQDFTIPAPQNPSPQAEPLPTPPAQSTTAANPFSTLERGPTTTELALGAAALVVLAVLFLFVRQGVRAHLINRRATLDAADGASWMLFSALMLTAAILVSATVGRLWQAWAGLAAGFALCLVLFGAALALFLRAPDRRR